MVYNTRKSIPNKVILSIKNLLRDTMYNYYSLLLYRIRCTANSVHRVTVDRTELAVLYTENHSAIDGDECTQYLRHDRSI